MTTTKNKIDKGVFKTLRHLMLMLIMAASMAKVSLAQEVNSVEDAAKIKAEVVSRYISKDKAKHFLNLIEFINNKKQKNKPNIISRSEAVKLVRSFDIKMLQQAGQELKADLEEQEDIFYDKSLIANDNLYPKLKRVEGERIHVTIRKNQQIGQFWSNLKNILIPEYENKIATAEKETNLKKKKVSYIKALNWGIEQMISIEDGSAVSNTRIMSLEELQENAKEEN